MVKAIMCCWYCILQAVVDVAGRATRTALIQHQARRDNMADVAAKDGSQVSSYTKDCVCVLYFVHLCQETLVNLAALLVGLVLTPAVAGWTEYVFTNLCTYTYYYMTTIILNLQDDLDSFLLFHYSSFDSKSPCRLCCCHGNTEQKSSSYCNGALPFHWYHATSQTGQR